MPVDRRGERSLLGLRFGPVGSDLRISTIAGACYTRRAVVLRGCLALRVRDWCGESTSAWRRSRYDRDSWPAVPRRPRCGEGGLPPVGGHRVRRSASGRLTACRRRGQAAPAAQVQLGAGRMLPAAPTGRPSAARAARSAGDHVRSTSPRAVELQVVQRAATQAAAESGWRRPSVRPRPATPRPGRPRARCREGLDEGPAAAVTGGVHAACWRGSARCPPRRRAAPGRAAPSHASRSQRAVQLDDDLLGVHAGGCAPPGGRRPAARSTARCRSRTRRSKSMHQQAGRARGG